VPLLDTFEQLLTDLCPVKPDPRARKTPLRDGDPLPPMRCPSGVNWLSMRSNGQPDVVAWAEAGPDGVKRLRLRMPPNLDECKANVVVASVDTGLTQTFDLTFTTPFEYRTYDGSRNNLQHPNAFGVANTPLRRVGAANYGDGRSTLRAGPNPRAISNQVARWPNAGQPPVSGGALSDMVWLWGQFVDHEIDLSPDDSGEYANVTAPADDPTLPDGVIALQRSRFVNDASGVRQQITAISAFIDATNVYGSSIERAMLLRLLDGTGRMKTSVGNLPPLNVGDVLPNANPTNQNPQDMFVCGDVRSNENPALFSMHTLFLRNHNRLCERFAAEHPEWRGDDECLFQEARRLNIAFMQHITFSEFLPALLGNGSGAIGPYGGYDDSLDASIANEFSTALYRVGHAMVSSRLQVSADSAATVPLADVFCKPQFIKQHGIDGVLEGAAARRMQRVDNFIVEALRDLLFGKPDQPPGALHDLATLNVQRGRDHGLPLYNDARAAYGLPRKASIDDISSSADVRAALTAAYGGDVDAIDLWIGALCEDHWDGGAQVGELIATGLKEQFERLRSGDRFWYEATLPADLLAEVRDTKLSDVIRANSNAQVAPDAFHVPNV